ncbi:hypothetical protein [Acinetobacter bereziniae]|nr:hypothetical protein [Acinetobacter bereziniae]
MREIVEGAPIWATGYAVMQKAYTLYNSYCADLKLDEIRTAIAKHDTTDHVTDIRNHLSPSTIVKDLEAERHG